VVNQEGDTFGPETVGGKGGQQDPEGQQREPGNTIQGPKPFDQGTNQKKEDHQAADKFRNPDFFHAALLYLFIQGDFTTKIDELELNREIWIDLRDKNWVYLGLKTLYYLSR
jgi:hypothetical protein